MASSNILTSVEINKLLLIKTTMMNLESQTPRNQTEYNFLLISWDQILEQLIIISLQKLMPNKTQKTAFSDKLKDLRIRIRKNELGILENEIDLQDIQSLHHLRNSIQHRGRNVNLDDFSEFIALAKKFVGVLVKLVFQTDLQDIKQLSLITNNELRQRLSWAYEELDNSNIILALAWSNNVINSIMSHASAIYGFEEKIMLFDFLPHNLSNVLEAMNYQRQGMDTLTRPIEDYEQTYNIDEKITILDKNLSKLIEIVDVYSNNLHLLYETQLGSMLSRDPRHYLYIKYQLDKLFDQKSIRVMYLKDNTTIPKFSDGKNIVDQVVSMIIRWEQLYPDIEIYKMNRDDLKIRK